MLNHDQRLPVVLEQCHVNKLLPQLDVMGLMKALFESLANEMAIQPSQTLTLLPEQKGDFITYLGALANEGVFGAKLSPYLMTDKQPIITAWTSLMSMHTGQPLLWCDSGSLTIERTAGTTALAIDLLAPSDIQHLALIGTGQVGLAHLRHALTLRSWQVITIHSPELAEDPALCDEVLAIDSRIQIAKNSTDCTDQADVIMLCTSSAAPVITLDDIKPTALVTSISTNAVNAHEVPPTFLGRADVYCDYKQTTPSSAGEMCLAQQQYQWDPATIKGDLADLVVGRCSLPDYSKPVFFRSIGLGLEDIAMAYGLWQLLVSSSDSTDFGLSTITQ